MFEDLWKPYVQPSKELKKVLPEPFLKEILQLYNEWRKNPDKLIEKIISRQEENAPKSAYELSLPRRKRYIGNVPIGMEIGLINTPTEFHYRLAEKLALSDQALGNISHLIAHLPDAMHFLEEMYKHKPLSGSNLGIYAHSFYHNRFEMTGAPIFSLDDILYRELCDTDISSKTPCEFFRAPMPMMYLEFGQTRHEDLPRTYNRETHWHALEGAYLNTYIITDKELTDECNDPNLALSDITMESNQYNIISHALVSGHIIAGGGDVHVLEVLSTGSPVGKSHIMDDATSQFALVVQDREMEVQKMLDWHIKFNRRELPSQVNQQDSGSSDYLPLTHVHRINDEEVESISNAVHAIAKSLLYINSETCKLTHQYDASEHKKALLRTKNKAKLRKLASKSRSLSDYILITLPKSEAPEIIGGTGEQKSGKSTHWRRAHFHTYRYGEGRKKLRVKWIPKTHVNPTKGISTTKDYRVK
jgi:hypothetical protein